jgi:hypothetical protein
MDKSNIDTQTVNNEIFSIEDKLKLERKIKNLNRSKMRLKKKLNTRITELEKRIEKLNWDDQWDNLD